MPPPDQPRNEALMASMTNYSLGNYVREMMQVMMESVLVEQPHDPLEFLINVLRNDPRIDALDRASRFNRMDLRRIATKTKHLRAIYMHDIVGGHVVGATDVAKDVVVVKLLASHRARQAFPRHIQEIVQAFGANDSPASVTEASFVAKALGVLSKPYVLT
ncbi:hypothetical protein H310_03940 [Aphanomyces invadans]|uniref:Uncharacterized protein n=1 Tax=Aphanomyces invadans TaxID=157072 RepID=A0A024UG02_9STRA|nr:hypothetical protein H310_03940 [Aphanomyces invadans]ETW04807.1 hypothetical protein H310_03940 [Aphanomyces invadans]|eukprot:XP_008866245.1 hypothetical protein H310_03940 [Aphanomyces invadans]